MDIDKAFFDRHETDPKILKRFNHTEKDLDDIKRQILIETPINCLLLQENVT